jgi:hypothetical protein
MFDSRQYEWADITLLLGGKDITGIRGINYTAKQEKEPVYGKGNLPASIQKGNFSYSGEITLLHSELETLIANSTNKSILSLELDAVVCYGNPAKGDAMIVDVLQGVQFTEESKGYKQGDKFAEMKLPFIFLRKKNQTT